MASVSKMETKASGQRIFLLSARKKNCTFRGCDLQSYLTVASRRLYPVHHLRRKQVLRITPTTNQILVGRIAWKGILSRLINRTEGACHFNIDDCPMAMAATWHNTHALSWSSSHSRGHFWPRNISITQNPWGVIDGRA